MSPQRQFSVILPLLFIGFACAQAYQQGNYLFLPLSEASQEITQARKSMDTARGNAFGSSWKHAKAKAKPTTTKSEFEIDFHAFGRDFESPFSGKSTNSDVLRSLSAQEKRIQVTDATSLFR